MRTPTSESSVRSGLQGSPLFIRLIFAFGLSIVGLMLQELLRGAAGNLMYFLLFPVIFIVFSVAGSVSGLCATVFCAIMAKYFFSPNVEMTELAKHQQTVRGLLFVGTGLGTSWFLSMNQRFQSRARERHALQRGTEKKFQTMADSAPVLIWLANTDKLCTWFNRGWLAFTGRTQEQEFGNGWTDGVHPEDRERCLKTFKENFDARLEFRMEYRLRHHSGEYRWITDSGLPRFDSEGTFEGYIGACMDIHAQKLSEMSLSEAIRSRDEFLSIASHELKTPLTSLKLQS